MDEYKYIVFLEVGDGCDCVAFKSEEKLEEFLEEGFDDEEETVFEIETGKFYTVARESTLVWYENEV